MIATSEARRNGLKKAGYAGLCQARRGALKCRPEAETYSRWEMSGENDVLDFLVGYLVEAVDASAEDIPSRQGDISF
jgi:hypothetical protein